MKYNLERKIKLIEKNEQQGINSWLLNEVGMDEKKIGVDLIPCVDCLYFTASELRLVQGFGCDDLEKDKKIENSECITAVLNPAIIASRESLIGSQKFSMLGTDRLIKKFSLYISKSHDENEICRVYGSISQTLENNIYGNENTQDSIGISLYVTESRFYKLADLIFRKAIDYMEFNIYESPGFYAEWHPPSFNPQSIKVLASEISEYIIKPDGCSIEPPRLGDFTKFELTLITYSIPKKNHDLKYINFYKRDSYTYEKNEQEESSKSLVEEAKLLLSNIYQKQCDIEKIKNPLWFISALLILLLLLKI